MRSLRTVLLAMLVSTGACVVTPARGGPRPEPPQGNEPPPAEPGPPPPPAPGPPPPPAPAPAPRAAMLAGTIVDAQTGLPIGRAAIDIVVAGVGKYTQQTDAQGNFAMTDIPPGEYALRVRRDGFRPWEQIHVMLHAGENPPLNVALQRK
jgi:Carboxypeptidase regulatory-like domain